EENMITQLSVFTENSKGAMLKVSRLISDAGIDIYNVVTNDSAEFGIVRMLVTEPEKGFEVLKSEGYMCKLDKVMGVEIPDEVGSLTKLLDTLDKSYINIDYIYVSYSRDSKTPLAVMKVGGYDEVESSLRSRGYTTV
ncbi:MAG: amino acid-binding protein, partial [Eubacterium sp.]|nr:amino acid-binding protein [Eubacterium sp.]